MFPDFEFFLQMKLMRLYKSKLSSRFKAIRQDAKAVSRQHAKICQFRKKSSPNGFFWKSNLTLDFHKNKPPFEFVGKKWNEMLSRQ